MSTVVIREFGEMRNEEGYLLDLSEVTVQDCCGCWSCWWKTPGRCIYKDLEDFYRAYIGADRAVFYTTVSQGFVSGNLKSLFDRFLPLYLPYSNFHTGESMHNTRYDRYPDVEIFYQGSFLNDVERQCYEDYLHRTFYQFHNPSCKVSPYGQAGEVTA